MGKKVLLNIFYNIAIFLLALGLIRVFNQRQYVLMIFVIFVLALFIYLKVILIKDVKELTRKS